MNRVGRDLLIQGTADQGKNTWIFFKHHGKPLEISGDMI